MVHCCTKDGLINIMGKFSVMFGATMYSKNEK